MADPRLDAFLAYIVTRGIPERFHALYRDEVLSVLMHAGVSSIERLTPDALQESVRAAERVVQNRKAVCAALDEYLRTLRKQSLPPLRPPRQTTPRATCPPDSARGSSAYPSGGRDEKRRFVRVPFNREVQMEGSLAPIRASDLSLGGLYLETRQALNAGEIIEIVFKLRADDSVPIAVRAQVVYIDPGMGVGVDFVELAPDVAREIRYFIEDVIGGRRF